MSYPDDFDSRAFARKQGENLRDWTDDEGATAATSDTAAAWIELAASGLSILPPLRCNYIGMCSILQAVETLRDLARDLRNNRSAIQDAIIEETNE